MARSSPWRQMLSSNRHETFANWQRWGALLWLAVWIPAYWLTWGASNFLQLCDMAVILTCIGIWSGSTLLISSQALSSLLIDSAWAVDAAAWLLVRRHVFGGTDYLFDTHYALWVRLLSLFHLVMPPLLLWALQRVRYDSRGLALECAITVVLFSAARFTNPAKNINFAFIDPFFRRPWGLASVHTIASVLFMSVVVYLPTHLLLKHLFPRPA